MSKLKMEQEGDSGRSIIYCDNCTQRKASYTPSYTLQPLSGTLAVTQPVSYPGTAGPIFGENICTSNGTRSSSPIYLWSAWLSKPATSIFYVNSSHTDMHTGTSESCWRCKICLHLHNTTKLIYPPPSAFHSWKDENIHCCCPEHSIIIQDICFLLVSN